MGQVRWATASSTKLWTGSLSSLEVLMMLFCRKLLPLGLRCLSLTPSLSACTHSNSRVLVSDSCVLCLVACSSLILSLRKRQAVVPLWTARLPIFKAHFLLCLSIKFCLVTNPMTLCPSTEYPDTEYLPMSSYTILHQLIQCFSYGISWLHKQIIWLFIGRSMSYVYYKFILVPGLMLST